MRTCRMCQLDREEVSMVQVAPATWNGFHDFVEVCPECQASRKFKVWSRARNTRSRPVGAAAAAASAEAGTATAVAPRVPISHRRTGAVLHEVEGQSLVGAVMPGAALSGADLQHATMRGADLHRADLHLADLAGADLREADLRGVNFRGADLRGADLRQAKLYRADFSHARYDRRTQWPTGFDPRTTGALHEDACW